MRFAQTLFLIAATVIAGYGITAWGGFAPFPVSERLFTLLVFGAAIGFWITDSNLDERRRSYIGILGAVLLIMTWFLARPCTWPCHL